METIEHAEEAGMVRYTGGAVLFVGYDSRGPVQNVTRRAIDEADPIQKRDLLGSDKRFPPVLPGDPDHGMDCGRRYRRAGHACNC
jgi:hypothetical protein